MWVKEKDGKWKQPFCTICFRYMSPAAARAHSKHTKAIKWPKKEVWKK